MRALKQVVAIVVLMVSGAGGLWAQDWESYRWSDIPDRGLVAGHDDQDSPLYIIRAPFEGGLTPGSFNPFSRSATVPWGGRANQVQEFELFAGSGQWVAATSRDPLPAGALKGGNEADGTPLYIIRASKNRALVPGKYSAKSQKAYIGLQGEEMEVTSFEFLVKDSAPAAAPTAPTAASAPGPGPAFTPGRWVAMSVSDSAEGAVAAGTSPDGTPSFLIRSPFGGGLVPGKFNPKAKTAYVPWGGKENPVKSIELYVGPGQWVAPGPGGAIPPGAVQAGNEQDGTPLLAIRAPSGKALVPGKYNVNNKKASISIGGKEVEVSPFEFLVEPPPAPTAIAAAAPSGGDSFDEINAALLKATTGKAPLKTTPLVVRGGAAAAVGELAAQDFQYKGLVVDAFKVHFDQSASYEMAFSTASGKLGDADALLFDARGIRAGDTWTDGPVIRMRGQNNDQGDYTLLVIQRSGTRPLRYGITLQETSFTLVGQVDGQAFEQESVVALYLDPNYLVWDVRLEADFPPEFEVRNAAGKVIGLSRADESGGTYSCQTILQPDSRGYGVLRITPRLPAERGTESWRLRIVLFADGGS